MAWQQGSGSQAGAQQQEPSPAGTVAAAVPAPAINLSSAAFHPAAITHQRCAARCTAQSRHPTAGPRGLGSLRPAGRACAGGSARPMACGGARSARAPGGPWSSSSASPCDRRCRCRVGGQKCRRCGEQRRQQQSGQRRRPESDESSPYPNRRTHCVEASWVPSALYERAMVERGGGWNAA